MRIYIAASATNFQRGKDLAEHVRSWGYSTSSIWHDLDNVGYEHEKIIDDIEIESDMSSKAIIDEEHVRAADVLVIITGDTLTRGGRHSECGMAIALGKRVYLLGPREQVFHWHPLVLPCNNIDALKVALDMAPPFDDGGESPKSIRTVDRYTRPGGASSF